MIFVLALRENTPNLEASVYDLCCEFCDVLSCHLVSAYEHQFEEDFTVVFEIVIFYKFNKQIAASLSAVGNPALAEYHNVA